MNKMIAYCGLTCNSCAIFLATREGNNEKKNKMRVEVAQQIKKIYDQEYKPEDVTDCDGCKTKDGKLFSGSNNCYIRKCAKGKRIENCAHCNEYACEKLKEFFATEPDAKKRLNEIKSRL